MHDTTDNTLSVGDRVVLDHPRLQPAYIKQAVCIITGENDKIDWGGQFASTPYRTFDMEIEYLERPRAGRARYRVGTKLVGVSERLIAEKVHVR